MYTYTKEEFSAHEAAEKLWEREDLLAVESGKVGNPWVMAFRKTDWGKAICRGVASSTEEIDPSEIITFDLPNDTCTFIITTVEEYNEQAREKAKERRPKDFDQFGEHAYEMSEFYNKLTTGD